MSLSRRAMWSNLGPGSSALSGALIAARGREAIVGELGPGAPEAAFIPPPQPGEIRISSNENPLGPSERAVAVLRDGVEVGNRYPTNSSPSSRDLRALIAEQHGTDTDHVALGAGSDEINTNASHAFTSPSRHLVTASPSYGSPRRVASYLGAEIKDPAVDEQGRLDLDAMAAASPGAGLVYVCNPNNPTGAVHSGDAIERFVGEVRRRAPDAVVLIDEAYHHYVTDPSYRSADSLALRTPNVIVARTFSKAYGMAGMRIGYGVGHADVMARLRRYELTFNTNTPGQMAAHAALQDAEFIPRERARNTEAKQYTADFFERAGYEVFDSQTNFIFVDLGRPAREFRDACSEHDVQVGRDFPPMEQTHSRISIGTMDEMRRAVEVFGRVLGVTMNSGRQV